MVYAMPNLGLTEVAFLVLIALILFGPRRLPEIAREMGRFMAEFKRASSDFQNQIHQEINKLELEEAAKSVAEGTDLTPETNSISSAISRLTERVKTLPQDYDA